MEKERKESFSNLSESIVVLNEKNKTHSRFHGIDLIRVMCMFFIVILHTLGHGGILGATTEGSSQYYAAWFAEIWVYCAVDLLAMISGFLCVNKQVKISQYFKRWGQVVFYSVVGNIFVLCMFPKDYTSQVVIEGLFPVMSGRYWYFTAYTGLFVFIPILNRALCYMQKSDIKWIIFLIILFSVYDTIINRFSVNNGYSVIWLIIMYLIGGIIRTNNIEGPRPLTICLLLIVLSIITFGWKIYGVSFIIIGNHISPDTLISYTSPTIVGMSMCYILLAKRIHVRDNLGKILSFLSKGAFAVYLINDHRYIRQKFLSNSFIGWAHCSTYLMIIYLIIYAMLFTVTSIIIDNVRDMAFSYVSRLIHKTIGKKSVDIKI